MKLSSKILSVEVGRQLVIEADDLNEMFNVEVQPNSHWYFLSDEDYTYAIYTSNEGEMHFTYPFVNSEEEGNGLFPIILNYLFKAQIIDTPLPIQIYLDEKEKIIIEWSEFVDSEALEQEEFNNYNG